MRREIYLETCNPFPRNYKGYTRTCTLIAENSNNIKRALLPDDFPQINFHFLKVRSFFWVLVPAAFYQRVHLTGGKNNLNTIQTKQMLKIK